MTDASTPNKYQKCHGCFLYLNYAKCLDRKHMMSVPSVQSPNQAQAHLCRPMAALRHQARFLIEHRCPSGEEKHCAKRESTQRYMNRLFEKGAQHVTVAYSRSLVRRREPLHVCVTCWVKHVLKGKKA